MRFPIFEALMLVCFGAAWPFSIWRSYRSRTNRGKSLVFLAVIEFGYFCGLVHKVFWAFDGVIWLYALNFLMVGVDLCLYVRNRRFAQDEAPTS